MTPVRIEPVALRSPVKHFTTVLPLKKIKNNLDPGQAPMVVFPDTMYTLYTCRDNEGGGGGSKLITFFSYLTFVTAKYCMH